MENTEVVRASRIRETPNEKIQVLNKKEAAIKNKIETHRKAIVSLNNKLREIHEQRKKNEYEIIMAAVRENNLTIDQVGELLKNNKKIQANARDTHEEQDPHSKPNTVTTEPWDEEREDE